MRTWKVNLMILLSLTMFRHQQQEYIVIVKNKIDKNILIKLRGFDKKSLTKTRNERMY